MRIYDRFWTDAEIGAGGDMVRSLNNEMTLFKVAAQSTEAARHGGPLSLKTVAGGETLYRFGGRGLAVRPGQFLLTPPGAPYSTHVGAAGARVLTLYFPPRLVVDAVTALNCPAARVLEGCASSSEPLFDFSPYRRRLDGRIEPVLRRLSQARRPDRAAELAMDALAATVAITLEIAGAAARVPGMRASVRRELFRRAAVAREMIEQTPEQKDGLAELAAAACLSPFHLHRVFKAAFGETPADMRRRCRIERAQDLLAIGQASVASVARTVGFEDASAFSRSFRAIAGCSPTAFREAVRS